MIITNRQPNLGGFANQRQARVNESLEHIGENFPMFLIERERSHVEPGLEERSPAETLRFHVDHATARHLHSLHHTDD